MEPHKPSDHLTGPRSLDASIRKSMAGMAAAKRSLAGYSDTMVAALQRQLAPLLRELKQDEEIGALLTSFGVSFSIRVSSIGHEDPHLIIIKGVDDDDEEVTLFQHVSQVNVLFKKVKVKPGKQARRIGFC